MSKRSIFIIVILVLFVTNIISYLVCQNNINSLNSKINSLSLVYDRFIFQYAGCLSNYTNLQSNFTNLSNEYDILHHQFITLQNNYSILQSTYNDTLNLPEVRFGRGGDCTLFVTPENSVVIERTKEILGDLSDGNLTIEDIVTINTWIGKNIEYFPDIDQHGNLTNFYRYPNETLEKGYGDCEDHAVLMVSMCKSEQNVPWLWCAHVGYYKNNKYNGHVCVFAKIDNKDYYVFDPTTKSGWRSNASDLIYYALEEDYATYLGVYYVDVFFIFNENTYRRYDDISEFFRIF